MSVNEVKLKQAVVEPFVVRGTGPPSSRTFCIGDEDHTVGNSLRHVLMQNANVGFAGYSVPHPSEPIVQIRVQTVAAHGETEAPLAIDTLKVACQTLSAQCDIVLQELERILPEVAEDRVKHEQFLVELAEAEQRQAEEEEEEEEY